MGVFPLLNLTPLFSPLKLRGEEGGLKVMLKGFGKMWLLRKFIKISMMFSQKSPEWSLRTK